LGSAQGASGLLAWFCIRPISTKARRSVELAAAARLGPARGAQLGGDHGDVKIVRDACVQLVVDRRLRGQAA
jgi:hypothetical protein